MKDASKRSGRIRRLVSEMLSVLSEAGIPIESRNARTQRRIAEAALAVAGISHSFNEAKSSDDGVFLTTRQIIAFENAHLGGDYSPGSYDDIRRSHLILLTAAGFVVNSSALETQSTNNPTRGYAASPAFAALLRSRGTREWKSALEKFLRDNEALREVIAHKRELEKIPVTLPSGVLVSLSAGEHNALQRDIVHLFLPRFGFGAQVLYIGDSTKRSLVRDDSALRSLHVFPLEHEELPDVVAYSAEKNILFLVEAVHSSGQMSEMRVQKLRGKLRDCTASPVFVSAFATRASFRKFAADIAWESEAWIAESPDHMIHFNGWKFLEINK